MANLLAPFTVQLRILAKDRSDEFDPIPTGYSAPTKVPFGQTTLLNVEIVSLHVTNSVQQLMSQAWYACSRAGGKDSARNGQSLEGIYDEYEIKKFVVEWESDLRGQQTWTEIHNGNVEAVLRRLMGREGLGRSDVLIMLH